MSSFSGVRACSCTKPNCSASSYALGTLRQHQHQHQLQHPHHARANDILHQLPYRSTSANRYCTSNTSLASTHHATASVRHQHHYHNSRDSSSAITTPASTTSSSASTTP